MSYLREPTGYARFADGEWVPIYTTSTVEVKTIEIGGNNPMPLYLYAALVTHLDLYMNEQLRATLWQNFPYEMYSREFERLGKDSQ